MRGALQRAGRNLATAGALLVTGAGLIALVLVALAALEGAAPAISAFGLRGLLNGLVAHQRYRVLLATVAVAIGFGLVSLLMPVTSYLQSEVGRRLELLVSDRLFTAINAIPTVAHLEQPSFLDKVRIAQQAGLQAPQQMVGSVVAGTRGGMTLFGFVIALLALDLRITVLALVAVVPGSVLGFRISARRAAAEMALSPGRRRAFAYSMMQTDLRAAKEIRLFSLGDYLRQQMREVLTSVTDSERRRDRAVLGWQLSIQISGLIFFTGAIAVASQDVWAGRLRIGDVALVLAALAGVQSGVATVNTALGQLANTLTLFDSYRELVDQRLILDAASGGPADDKVSPPGTGSVDPRLPTLGRLERALTMHDVWFRYDEGGRWILRGVDLTLPVGSSTALVGVNGAGKSTLAKLICGLYRPTRGEICWDGKPIDSVDLAEYRRRLSAVFQDFMTYDLTARQNIQLGDLDRADDQSAVLAAAEAAGLHETLAALSKGYDTMLSRVFFGQDGERGVVLSGGQWQRLAVARALMRSDAELLVLDEPSSGLDAEAEYQLVETLRMLRRRQTSLVISHRLNAIVDVDSVVVLADGVIVEQGSHRDLLARGGRYAELFQLQAAGYRDEGGV